MRLKHILQNSSLHTILALAGVIVFFGASALLAQRYEDELFALGAHDSVLGMGMYIAITAIAIILAPVSTLPLIPLAVGMWGWFATGVLSIIGWTIGSQVAFFLARTYGKMLVQKFVSLERFSSFERRFSEGNIFWTVVLLRMTVPVDILSYALGLFSHMSTRAFFLATIIGVTPFAFIFSYLGSLPPGFQIITLIETALLIFIIHYFWRKRSAR